MDSFQDKNIVVVGGSSGIGAAVLSQLLGKGANLFNVSRTSTAVIGATNIQLDVTEDFVQIQGLPDKIDGLVYCPGTINLKPFLSLKTSDFQHDFEVNVLGAVKVVKALLKQLKVSESASVVFFSTVAVAQGLNFHASIATAKGAVEGLTKSLAAELAKNKIRVNAIAPSLTDTPLASGLLGSDERRKLSEERHPLKAIGDPEDVASMVAFLLSDSAKWMTGQILHMDGGLSSVKPI
ncbi:MAG: NAD(P)-dependent dehydrogenase (short-subunit alcohol dehydrogenase family) [Cyclobacteriaceae bacterium]|jgi:NAD(P)-dependent dehydrogenase (short-subunit alcohol dehydrogenase family)